MCYQTHNKTLPELTNTHMFIHALKTHMTTDVFKHKPATDVCEKTNTLHLLQ